MMLPDTADTTLTEQLLRIARDPDLRQLIYERLGDYCHQCRNRLNSLKLSLYLAMRQAPSPAPETWSEIDRRYQELERRVDQIQTLCRPMSLSRVTVGIDLLIDDRRDAWTRSMASNGRTLEFVAPAERAIASFDVERLGKALDFLVDSRGANQARSASNRIRWWVEAGYAHIVWEESRRKLDGEPDGNRDENPNWALPLLVRVALAHEGELRVQDDRGWKLELSWPVLPATP